MYAPDVVLKLREVSGGRYTPLIFHLNPPRKPLRAHGGLSWVIVRG